MKSIRLFFQREVTGLLQTMRSHCGAQSCVAMQSTSDVEARAFVRPAIVTLIASAALLVMPTRVGVPVIVPPKLQVAV
jgi:hypothetical protein